LDIFSVLIKGREEAVLKGVNRGVIHSLFYHMHLLLSQGNYNVSVKSIDCNASGILPKADRVIT
jgi:hypothetical protein